MEYIGSSQINDYLGDEIVNCNEEQGIFIVEINREEMIETRNKLNFLNDKDVFKIEK